MFRRTTVQKSRQILSDLRDFRNAPIPTKLSDHRGNLIFCQTPRKPPTRNTSDHALVLRSPDIRSYVGTLEALDFGVLTVHITSSICIPGRRSSHFPVVRHGASATSHIHLVHMQSPPSAPTAHSRLSLTESVTSQ